MVHVYQTVKSEVGTECIGGAKGLEGASEDRAKELDSTGRDLQNNILSQRMAGQVESSKMVSLSSTKQLEEMGVGGRVGTSQTRDKTGMMLGGKIGMVFTHISSYCTNMPTAMDNDARTWSIRFSGSGFGTIMGSGIGTGAGIVAGSGSVSEVG